MSVLLVPLVETGAEAIARRLLLQGDQVRVIARSHDEVERWKALGVFAARGAPEDEDLVERAAQNVRSLIVIGDRIDAARLQSSLAGARAARVPRIIVCCDEIRDDALGALNDWSLEYVVLLVRRPGLRRRRVPDEELARAVDEADDVAGAPRQVVRLWEVER